MKKVINGKKYDTDTAKCLKWYQYGAGGDLYGFEESLYQKTTGEYFLYGEGGAKTSYGESEGPNTWTYGWKIIPYTEDEAKDWVERHYDGDTYEEIFGEVAE